MKILFILTEGIGNVCQTIPLYLALNEKHEVYVAYLAQYPTDSVEYASFFPAIVDECSPEEVDSLELKYDYCIRPPFLTKTDGDDSSYVREIQDDFFERDSEFARNMKVLKEFDIEPEIKRDFYLAPSHHKADVCICNGAQKGWERKRYPFMGEVAKILTDKGVSCISIGKPEEYVPCTANATGTSLKRSVGTIANSKCFLGTDTGCYHIAALMEKPGVAIFTTTDPMKNWDKNFHHSIQRVHNYLPCQPCQRGFHFYPEYGECKEWRCRDINPIVVAKMVINNLGD